jgi:pyruvate dehydrogenase E2 component (dihydrolipoamide acetyltransferase)
MATNVIMPALGVAQQTGTLLKWLKAEGQAVTKGEPLMEVETDKATVEIEAAASGILMHVTAKPGDEVPVGQPIALILAPGEVATPAPVQDRHPRIAPGAGSRPEPSTHNLQSKPGTEPNPPISPFVKGGLKGDFLVSETSPLARARILASPAAKRIAKERGIDIAILEGSGPEGSVLAEDVLRAAQSRGDRPVAPVSTAPDVVPLTPMRRIVGQRMTQSKQSAPHFYLSMDIDMTAVVKVRTDGKERGDESIPSINDFILLACARALKDFPSVNSTFTEQGIKIHPDINIGMAVALEEGLVVPVIRNADRLTLTQLAQKSRELADKAQTKKLFPLDYEGGTFTVSNLGMLGVDSFIAIINPPQCAILATGRVAPRVVADEVGMMIRPMMTATLSADHRVVDGAIAARFLQTVKQQLEKDSH